MFAGTGAISVSESTSRAFILFGFAVKEQSLLRLIAALLMETNQERMGRIYLRMEEEPRGATEAMAAAA